MDDAQRIEQKLRRQAHDRRAMGQQWVAESFNEAADLIARLRVDAEKMRAFCREALDEFWEGDGSMQDMGERHGLLIATEYAEPCGEACSCAEYGAEFPTECYRFAPCLREAATAPMRAEEKS